jgi:hypothetical protein
MPYKRYSPQRNVSSIENGISCLPPMISCAEGVINVTVYGLPSIRHHGLYIKINMIIGDNENHLNLSDA